LENYFYQWLGNKDYREINRIKTYILPKINGYSNLYQKIENLNEIHNEIQNKIQKVDVNQELRIQAFALVKEVVRRVNKISMHDVQLIGAWILCDGKISEMMTGEGKTLVSLIPAYWFALQRKGVHMITVNEYLAKRDYEIMNTVFQHLGLSVGLNTTCLSEQEKKAAYLQDITYGTCTEFGFDYLRDQMVMDLNQRVQRELSFAIIDEVDSILIDEARTPLIIAGKTKAAPDLYFVCARFVKGLKEERDYEVDWQTNQVMFTEMAIKKIEATFMIENLYELEHTTVYHYLLQSLRAKVLMQRDVDYIVSDSKVHIIDAFTGRILEGRQFSEGLHQAIEAKENVTLSEENRTHATITIQKFFGLYKQIVGMTGTIKTAEEEMNHIYGLEVVSVPTHTPVIRQDYDDVIYLTKNAKYERVITEIQYRHGQGQPVLVGTTSVQQSEYIANRLAELKLPHQVLNAKSEKEESETIARAGLKGAITIATNMAGRGTDIRLAEGVAELGGLHVIGTERHESRRVDNQLRGRSGRQGDPGSSQFFLSLEDDLVERFASDEVEDMRAKWFWGSEGCSGGKIQAFMENVQKSVEQQMLAIRSIVFRLDAIVHEQRQSFYKQRNEVLDDKAMSNLLFQTVTSYLKRLIDKYCPENSAPEEWDILQLNREVGDVDFFSIDPNLFVGRQDIIKNLINQWTASWNEIQNEHMKSNGDQIWRAYYIQIIDRYWLEHMETLQHLKQGIHYQAYALKDPLQTYQDEAWKLFGHMGSYIIQTISQKVIKEVNDFKMKSLITN
jgi:preprotein translocase subunit SecA